MKEKRFLDVLRDSLKFFPSLTAKFKQAVPA